MVSELVGGLLASGRFSPSWLNGQLDSKLAK